MRLYEERTGLALANVEKNLQDAEKAGLLERDWRRFAPSARGRLFLNELLQHFLCAAPTLTRASVPLRQVR